MYSRVHGTGNGSSRTEGQGEAHGQSTEGPPSHEGTPMSKIPEWWRVHLEIYMEKLWGGRGLLPNPSHKEDPASAEAQGAHAEQGGLARPLEGKGDEEQEDRRTPPPTPYRRPQQSGELRQASGEQTDEKPLDTENGKDDHVRHG